MAETFSGTEGFLPGQQGWIVFCCPVPGAIIYRIILPVENPHAALARLKDELGGATSMMVGVESLTAISIAICNGL
jgi:hypothetical protein